LREPNGKPLDRSISCKHPSEDAVTTVALVGLGAIGFQVAHRLDRGIPGLQLIAVAARDLNSARLRVAGFTKPPIISGIEDLGVADIIVEAAGASVLPAVVDVAIRHQRTVVACSVGALLQQKELVDKAAAHGVRIIVPSGALGGLDAVSAASEGNVASVVISSRKPPSGLAGAPFVVENKIDLAVITEPLCLFRGSAREAAKGFPANLNVAAALALAGIGPDRTQVEIWADPHIERNIHSVQVVSDSVRMSITLEGMPSPANPRTSQLTSLSVLATIRGLVSPLKIGT
jgi:aspartate dehydrogenase